MAVTLKHLENNRFVSTKDFYAIDEKNMVTFEKDNQLAPPLELRKCISNVISLGQIFWFKFHSIGSHHSSFSFIFRFFGKANMPLDKEIV